MKSKKVAFLGLSIALAMVLSFVESQIPTPLPYGIKLGLPNLVIVFLLYKAKWWETAAVSLIRVFLVSFILFGNVQVWIYSLFGAVLSLLGMILLKQLKFSCITVSIVGGVLHNVGQIIAACLLWQRSEFIYYLPLLLVSGTVAGVLIGILSGMVVKRLEKVKF